jgi:hypothetical protein
MIYEIGLKKETTFFLDKMLIISELLIYDKNCVKLIFQ